METGKVDPKKTQLPQEEYKALLKMATETGKRREQWHKMFSHYIQRVEIPPLGENDFVLNIGCGFGEDNLPLNSALTRQPFGFSGKLSLIGIDKNSKAIQAAKELNHTGVKEYILGDAQNLRSFFEEKARVIICRDPNLAEEPEVWTRIFKQAFPLTIKSGFIIGTARLEYERNLLRYMLSEAGYTIIVDEENKFSGKEIEHGGINVACDKFVLIGKRITRDELVEEVKEKSKLPNEMLQHLLRIYQRHTTSRAGKSDFLEIISDNFGNTEESLLVSAGFRVFYITTLEDLKQNSSRFMAAQILEEGNQRDTAGLPIKTAVIIKPRVANEIKITSDPELAEIWGSAIPYGNFIDEQLYK